MQAIKKLPLTRGWRRAAARPSGNTNCKRPAWLIEQARSARIRGRFPALIWDDVAQQLSPRSRDYLRRTLVPLARRVFDRTSVRFWLDWLADTSLDQLKRLILVYNDDGDLIAWAASSDFSVNGRRCFYGSSAGVHPDYQGQGITSATARRLFLPALFAAAPRTLYAIVRTGNPLVYSAWQAGSVGRTQIFPSPEAGPAPAAVRQIAAAAAHRLGQRNDLDLDTLIMRDAYGSEMEGLWASRPVCDQGAVCRWFNAVLGPRDAVLMVVPFNPAAMFYKEIMREARRRTGRGVTDSSRRAESASAA